MKNLVFLYKMDPNVPTPRYGTSMSACFDLTFFPISPFVSGYDIYNQECARMIVDKEVPIYPGDRLLIPTGLVMKLNEPNPNLSIRLHPRSSFALKRGLVLANSEGIIDIDYQLQIFVLLTNISEKLELLKKGERVAQGEIVYNRTAEFRIVENMPTQHSERDGGFGSTGAS